jgi:hypothetical protein
LSERPEESKVNQASGPLPESSSRKKGASNGLRVVSVVFKEQGSSQSGERSLLRWFWSFTGTSGTAQPQPAAALVVILLPVLFSLG